VNLCEIVFLFSVMVMLSIIPSASVALVVARSSTNGFLNGAAVSAGIVAGDLVFVTIAVLGMTALADIMGSWFLALRYLASAYLIWFGISLFKSANSSSDAPKAKSASSFAASFLSGLFLTLGDVKAIVFYASFFPAFVDLAAAGPIDIATIILVTLFAVGGVKLGYAYFATKVMSYAVGFRGRRFVTRTTGGVMVGAGAYLIAKA